MKKLPVVLAFLLLLIPLPGCGHGNNCAPPPFGPTVSIQYVDRSGNDLMKGLNEGSLKILSITDQEGTQIQFHPPKRFIFDIGETYSLGKSPQTERIYTIRYQIPALLGEDRVETLKLVYLVDGWGKFTEAWYNQERIEYNYYPNRYNPEVGPPTPAEVEANMKAMEEKRYNGTTNAFHQGSYLFLVLAIDKP